MNKEILIYRLLQEKPDTKKLNQSDIDKLQKDYNIKLPEDYIDFLLKTNGGNIISSDDEDEKKYFSCNKFIDEVYHGVQLLEFYNTNLILYFLEDKENAPEYQELLDINLFPIGSDGSYAHEFFIGVVEENFGEIYFYERFMFRIDNETIHYVCSSFTDLLNGFYLIDIQDLIDEKPEPRKIFS